MKRHVGRPRSVEHGIERRPFQFMASPDAAPRDEYCSVAWMVHHGRLAATASFRAPTDVTYLGMAHGDTDGYYRRGDARAYGPLALTGRESTRRADQVDAVVALAVLALEAAVAEAMCGPVPSTDHPWTGEDIDTFKVRLAGARRRRGVTA